MKALKKVRRRLREEYQLILINNQTFSTSRNYKFKLGNLIGLGLFTFVGIVVSTSALIYFTPLRQLAPGYMDESVVEQTAQLKQIVAELKKKTAKQDTFLNSLRRVSGIEVEDNAKRLKEVLPNDLQQNLDETSPAAPDKTSPAVPQARPDPEAPAQELPATPQQALQATAESTRTMGAFEVLERNMFFFAPPLNLNRAVITQHFNLENNHKAVDIAAPENSPVMAVADGHVIFSDYTISDGYVIGISHRNGFVSFYKHNSRLLKPAGSYVYAGEPIAFIGNTGENSTGPHLHFELWQHGKAVNPSRFINFKQKS